MAWVTSHQGLDGATYWYLHCRRCLPRCRAIGPLQEADARREVARHDRETHGRDGGRRIRRVVVEQPPRVDAEPLRDGVPRLGPRGPREGDPIHDGSLIEVQVAGELRGADGAS